MKFTTPVEFEIPDNWWVETGMLRFRPQGMFYRCDRATGPNHGALTLPTIEPPKRSPGVRAFAEARMRYILLAFAADTPLPAIEVYAAPLGLHRYRVRDGFHRFYASAAAGFECIPISIVEPPFEFETSAISPSGG